MERVDYAGLRDDELMDRLASRDLGAFGALYDRYSDLVYSVSLRVVADAQIAEDVTQDVFLRVWRRPELFDLTRGKFVTWLLSVARNRSIDERRSQGRRLRREAAPATAAEVEDVLPSTDERDDPARRAAGLGFTPPARNDACSEGVRVHADRVDRHRSLFVGRESCAAVAIEADYFTSAETCTILEGAEFGFLFAGLMPATTVNAVGSVGQRAPFDLACPCINELRR